MRELLKFSPEVQEAKERGKPIVALESTLIAHGFPYPENFQLALELEDILRQAQVVPATIGIIQGKLKIGLAKQELEYIATSPEMPKASVRDIPILLANKLDGATTVASTMQIASLAGVRTFVTGGIGGVHRAGEQTFDISADLQALSKYDVTVVCAGAKSVLDLPKTLEVLETLGVPIVGYQTSRFPAFYIRESGLPLDYAVESSKEVADIMVLQDTLQTQQGLVVAVPIPPEDELDAAEFSKLLDEILHDLNEQGISGKRVTPYLLHELHTRSAGKTVAANIALIKNNLRVGAEIAKHYAERRA